MMGKIYLSFALVIVVHSSAFGQSNPSPTRASQLIQEASRLQNAGKFEEAARKWKEFLSDYSADPAAGLVYQGLGACFLEMGEWQESVDALKQALKLLPKGESGSAIRWNLAIGLYRRAESTKTADHRKEVTAALQSLLADKETTKERQTLATFYLARTELAMGDMAAAKQRFEQLLNITADKELVAPVLLALAGLAEDAKDWPTARNHYRVFLRDFPNHASAREARLGLADALLHEGQYQEAETLFGELVKRQDQAGADYVHFRWAEIAELRGDKNAAAERWTTFLDKHPKSALRERGLRRTAQVHLRLKQYAEAATAFSTWLKENPDHEERASTQVQLGLALVQLDKFAEAEENFKSAVKKLPPGDLRSQALLETARCAVKLQRPADAVKCYEELLTAKTASIDETTTRLEAVAAAFAAGDSKRGLEWADQMVQGFEKSQWTSHAQLHAARYLTDSGKFDLALERSRWVLEAKVPEVQSAALYMAGFCAMKLRKFADAATYYQAIVDDHPQAEQAPIAAYSLGVVFESQGASGKALAAYQAFIKRNADHPLAAEARKRVRLLQDGR
jgi:tetratricopeptide (TPR) repeat protein